MGRTQRLLDRSESIEDWHPNIQEDEIRLCRTYQRDGVSTVISLANNLDVIPPPKTRADGCARALRRQ